LRAIETAVSGPLEEGNVGGGTGMICYDFKGGTGTASRRLPEVQGGYIVGVLVQANFGERVQLLVAGAPVGKELLISSPLSPIASDSHDRGSIIVVLATDAPLLPHQLKRLARRAALGVARTGGMAGNSSGDIIIAFSTANPGAARPGGGIAQVHMLSNDQITPLFNATALATEEAIINTLVAAQTMTGADGHSVYALPHDRLREVLAKYRRLMT
jgi:L-aminopeptidase/D-esterase-like protein